MYRSNQFVFTATWKRKLQSQQETRTPLEYRIVARNENLAPDEIVRERLLTGRIVVTAFKFQKKVATLQLSRCTIRKSIL